MSSSALPPRGRRPTNLSVDEPAARAREAVRLNLSQVLETGLVESDPTGAQEWLKRNRARWSYNETSGSGTASQRGVRSF